MFTIIASSYGSKWPLYGWLQYFKQKQSNFWFSFGTLVLRQRAHVFQRNLLSIKSSVATCFFLPSVPGTWGTQSGGRANHGAVERVVLSVFSNGKWTARVDPYGCQPKNSGKNPKMDGENKGKPYEQMDDLGVFPSFLGWHPYETAKLDKFLHQIECRKPCFFLTNRFFFCPLISTRAGFVSINCRAGSCWRVWTRKIGFGEAEEMNIYSKI